MKSKNIGKLVILVALCAVIFAVSCVSAYATDYSVVTKYAADNKVSVNVAVSNIETERFNGYVTYIAKKGEEIKYIDQQKYDLLGETVVFNYKTSINDIDAVSIFGGDGSNAEAQNEEFYSATVTFNGASINAVPKFVKYVSGIKPYNVPRIIEIPDGIGSYTVTAIRVGETPVNDYIVRDDQIILYTDLIHDEGTKVYIDVQSSEDFTLYLGQAHKEENSVVVTAKTTALQNYGVVVSTANAFDNAVEWGEDIGFNFANPVKFPALAKNSDGVYAIELEGLDAGTYYFQAYAQEQTDSTGFDGEEVFCEVR